MDSTMDVSVMLVIIGCLGVLAIALFGGKLRFSADGVEVDTDGLLKYLREAAKEKGRPFRSAEMNGRVRSFSRKLPVAAILWVDDKALNNRFERRALATLGIYVDAYANNADALIALKFGSYDLIISDISRGSQKESGWDLLAAARGMAKDVPFAMYTGNVDLELSRRARSLGAGGVFDQPDELVGWIIAELNRRRSEQSFLK